jgi:hypothetical protein
MNAAAEGISNCAWKGWRWICWTFCGILESIAQRPVHLYEATFGGHEL